MFSMMEQEKKQFLKDSFWLNILFYVFYDGAREKTIFKKSFCDNIIFGMLSMMEQERKRFSKNSFSDSILFCMFSMMKQEKKQFSKNSLYYNITFFVFSMME